MKDNDIDSFLQLFMPPTSSAGGNSFVAGAHNTAARPPGVVRFYPTVPMTELERRAASAWFSTVPLTILASRRTPGSNHFALHVFNKKVSLVEQPSPNNAA